MTMAVMGVTKFERFFRAVAELDVDKSDVKPYEDFVHRKLHDHATRPPLDLALNTDTEARLPEIAGELSVARGRSFRIVEPKLRNPQTKDWQGAFALFDLLA
jgi:hypothetical protein